MCIRDRLDANISPAKTEVRFSNEKSVFDAIYFAVKNGLLGYDQSREIQLPNVSENNATDNDDEPVSTVTIPSGSVTSVPEKKSAPESFYRRVVPFEFPRPESVQSAEQEVLPEVLPPLMHSELKPNISEEKVQEELPGFSFLSSKSFEKREQLVSPVQAVQQTPAEEEIPVENIRVIGELFKTYILCESGESMILIDKHAAHERINFERFKKGVNIHGQLLIEPREVALSPEEYEAVGSYKQRLENTGILLKLGEDGKVLVEGMPQSLESADPAELLQSIADILVQGNDNAEGALFDDVLHTMACKASIRANEDQDVSELAYLANMVLKDNNIRYCPHGRPVMTQISKKQIEKYFGRIV